MYLCETTKGKEVTVVGVSTNMALATVAHLSSCTAAVGYTSPVHEIASQSVQFFAVKPANYGQSSSRKVTKNLSRTSLATTSGLRVGRVPAHLASVRQGGRSSSRIVTTTFVAIDIFPHCIEGSCKIFVEEALPNFAGSNY